MDAIINYIKPELLILIPVLYAIGAAAKKIEVIKDKYIPLILGSAGVILAVIWVLATSTLASPQDILTAIFTALTQGILCAAGSVYFNQVAIKQPKKEE
jgi:hypothetical protein